MIKVYIRRKLEKGSKRKHIGSVPEDLRFSFSHISPDGNRHCNCEKASLEVKEVYVNNESRVLAKKTDNMEISDLVSETELCNFGYTLLCPVDISVWKRDLYYIDGIKPVLRSDYFGFPAFICVSWPESTSEWVSRDRPSGWPEREHIEVITRSECLVIPKAHPKSVFPECEWQFIFPDAEQILAKDCLSKTQKYCFRVFKGLVDFYLRNGPIRLSTTHLKTVMYFACEVIPPSCWSENVGGCTLYLLDQLGIYLSEKNIPNYFIKENNMIDSFTEEQITWAKEKVLNLRLFPVKSIIHFGDHHGFGIHMLHPILAHMKNFQQDREANRAIHGVFVPNLVRSAIDFAKTRHYSVASILFQRAYDEMVKAPNVSGYVQLENKISTFERFLQEVLNKQTDECLRNCLAYTFDTYCGTHFGYRNDIKTLKSIMGEGAVSYSGYPITRNVDDILSEARYIDEWAYLLFQEQKYEDSARFARCAVVKVKRELQNINSNLTNMNVLQTSACPTNENCLRRNEVLEELYCCLLHLFLCYQCLGMTALFQEYIDDLEDVAYKCHCTTKLHSVANIWDKLGNRDRAQDIRSKIPDLL